jgi:putative restriction endonuclease
VYFHAVVEGRYLAWWPVLVVGDEPEHLRFWIQGEAALAFGGAQLSGPLDGANITDEAARRRYATRLIQTRLHQRGFRERVLRAYQEQCAMCRLRQRELLDAAHIKPDTAGGAPDVSNGLALCKIHHTAFDVGVLGVNPADLRIEVRRDILDQVDGPMLRHGLQELKGERIRLPRAVADHPDTELLRWKWERFDRAG